MFFLLISALPLLPWHLLPPPPHEAVFSTFSLGEDFADYLMLQIHTYWGLGSKINTIQQFRVLPPLHKCSRQVLKVEFLRVFAQFPSRRTRRWWCKWQWSPDPPIPAIPPLGKQRSNNVFPHLGQTVGVGQQPAQVLQQLRLQLHAAVQLARPRLDVLNSWWCKRISWCLQLPGGTTALHVLQRWGGRRQRRTRAARVLLQDWTRAIGIGRLRLRRLRKRWCNKSSVEWEARRWQERWVEVADQTWRVKRARGPPGDNIIPILLGGRPTQPTEA